MTLLHTFAREGHPPGGCGTETTNPERGVAGNVLCAKCDAYFPAKQFHVPRNGRRWDELSPDEQAFILQVHFVPVVDVFVTEPAEPAMVLG